MNMMLTEGARIIMEDWATPIEEPTLRDVVYAEAISASLRIGEEPEVSVALALASLGILSNEDTSSKLANLGANKAFSDITRMENERGN